MERNQFIFFKYPVLHFHPLMWPATSLDLQMLTWQMVTNSQCSSWKQQLFSYLETLFNPRTALYSRAPTPRRDITSATCLPDHNTRQQQGIQGSPLITKEQNLPATAWEKQVNRTKRAMLHLCQPEKKKCIYSPSRIECIALFSCSVDQSIPEARYYQTGAGKLNQITQLPKRD